MWRADRRGGVLLPALLPAATAAAAAATCAQYNTLHTFGLANLRFSWLPFERGYKCERGAAIATVMRLMTPVVAMMHL